jgi:hypothetical protein
MTLSENLGTSTPLIAGRMAYIVAMITAAVEFKGGAARMVDHDQSIVISVLSGDFRSDGMTVGAHIVCLEHEREWTLEAANSSGASIVRENSLKSEGQTYAEFCHRV